MDVTRTYRYTRYNITSMIYHLLGLACLPLPHASLTYASSGKAVHDDPARHVRQIEVEAILTESCGIKIKVTVTVAVTAVVAVRPQHYPQVGRHECAMPKRGARKKIKRRRGVKNK